MICARSRSIVCETLNAHNKPPSNRASALNVLEPLLKLTDTSPGDGTPKRDSARVLFFQGALPLLYRGLEARDFLRYDLFILALPRAFDATEQGARAVVVCHGHGFFFTV